MGRKRQHEEEHENHERWLVSYADFITLLFAFFVVMYSVSRVDQDRVVQAEQSVRWAMHYEGTGGVGDLPLFQGPPSEGGCVANIGEGRAASQQVAKAVEHLAQRLDENLATLLSPLSKSSSVSVEAVGNRLAVRLAASRFFDAGSAAIRPEALPVLDAVVGELVRLDRLIRVEGHTDVSPVVGGRFRDNWELSSSRAAAVVSYIEAAHDVPPERLLAAGHGASRPIAAGDDAPSREANRRIEMVLEFDAADPSVAGLLTRR